MNRYWREDASCTQIGSEPFFLDQGGSARPAKKICNRCPVIAECLAFALERHQYEGIWGGLTERERRGMYHGGLRRAQEEGAA